MHPFSSPIINYICSLHSKHFFAKLVLHRSSIIYKIVINIMIIAVIYTAKSQHSFVDSWRRDDIYRFRSLACIQSQSRTTSDLVYISTVVPALGDPRRERPPAVYGHFVNVPTNFNVKLPLISGHLPNADADSHIHVKSPGFAGRLPEFSQIPRSPGRENESPDFYQIEIRLKNST